MLVSKSSANRRASQPKHKAACDQCNASKVKCPGGGPPCKRCADSSQHCHYSLARRFRKPPGSKNKKTLEKARQAKEGKLEGSNSACGGCFIPQNNGSRDDGDGTLDGESERWEGDESLDRLQTSSSTDFWTISPLINYPAFPDASPFIPSPGQDFFDGHHNVPLDGGDGSVIHSADPKLPDVEGLRRVESRRTWADDPDQYWNVSTRPRCTPTLINRQISLHHQALTSSSLQVPQTPVCLERHRLAK